MLTFLANNWGTLLVGLIVAAAATAVIVKIARDKRKGKCVSCDCGCKACPYEKHA